MDGLEKLTERFAKLAKEYYTILDNFFNHDWLSDQFDQISKEYQMDLKEVKKQFQDYMLDEMRKAIIDFIKKHY
mgnify:CR=1 FL=1